MKGTFLGATKGQRQEDTKSYRSPELLPCEVAEFIVRQRVRRVVALGVVFLNLVTAKRDSIQER